MCRYTYDTYVDCGHDRWICREWCNTAMQKYSVDQLYERNLNITTTAIYRPHAMATRNEMINLYKWARDIALATATATTRPKKQRSTTPATITLRADDDKSQKLSGSSQSLPIATSLRQESTETNEKEGDDQVSKRSHKMSRRKARLQFKKVEEESTTQNTQVKDAMETLLTPRTPSRGCSQLGSEVSTPASQRIFHTPTRYRLNHTPEQSEYSEQSYITAPDYPVGYYALSSYNADDLAPESATSSLNGESTCSVLSNLRAVAETFVPSAETASWTELVSSNGFLHLRENVHSAEDFSLVGDESQVSDDGHTMVSWKEINDRAVKCPTSRTCAKIEVSAKLEWSGRKCPNCEVYEDA